MPLNPGHSAFDALPTVADNFTSLGPGSIPAMDAAHAQDAVDPKQVNRTVAAVRSLIRGQLPNPSEMELGVIREAAEEGKSAQEIAKEVLAHYGEDAAATDAEKFKPGDKVKSIYGKLGTVVEQYENNVVVQPSWHTGSPENWHVTKTFRV